MCESVDIEFYNTHKERMLKYFVGGIDRVESASELSYPMPINKSVWRNLDGSDLYLVCNSLVCSIEELFTDFECSDGVDSLVYLQTRFDEVAKYLKLFYCFEDFLSNDSEWLESMGVVFKEEFEDGDEKNKNVITPDSMGCIYFGVMKAIEWVDLMCELVDIYCEFVEDIDVNEAKRLNLEFFLYIASEIEMFDYVYFKDFMRKIEQIEGEVDDYKRRFAKLYLFHSYMLEENELDEKVECFYRHNRDFISDVVIRLLEELIGKEKFDEIKAQVVGRLNNLNRGVGATWSSLTSNDE